MKRSILACCAALLAFVSPALLSAAGKAKAASLSHSPRARTNGVEAEGPVAGETSLADTHREVMVERVGTALEGVGHAFGHAASSGAGLFHRPPGWDRGNKTGWHGSVVPPGQAKKDSRFPLLRRHVPAIAADINRREVANFDRFLDSHPTLEKSLSQNPPLINNPAFLASNPSLSAWLSAHPQAAAELRENPQAFLRLEHRLDVRDAKARFPRDEDITRLEVTNFDRFLDTNPGVAASLKANPSLINNSAFLSQNPALSTWLKTHPPAAAELRENPRAFMSRERRFDALEMRLPRDEDITRPELANFDHFLDANPSVAASLSKNPSLINNATFLAQNPSLSNWLKTHPQAAAELRENPRAFLRLEHRFDVREAKREEPREDEIENEGRLPLGDVTRRELARFDRFLDTNPSVAASLSKNPSLINNATFLAQNPSLSNWLKTHPQAAAEFEGRPTSLLEPRAAL